MRTHQALLAALAAATLLPAARGDMVTVEVRGIVEWNQVTFGAFAAVTSGNFATLRFRVDSDVFTNSPTFPTRGYHINPNSFELTMGVVTVGLQSPMPVGVTPYFVIRNDDPAVDGFMVSSNVDNPLGVALAEQGKLGPFRNNYYVTYVGSMLASLDILDALGTYAFTGLTVYNWTLDDGSFQPIGIEFREMTIVVEGSCYADCDQSTGVGVLDVFDFLCFQDSFVSGSKYACECDGSTGVGVCDVFDFLCFQDAFVGGCP